MNIIFKRKKPIVVDIPPRPDVLAYFPPSLFEVKQPELNSGKVFYPIGFWCSGNADYFTTRAKARAECDKLNAVINKENKKLEAKRKKQIEARNKEIADWDAKYKNKAIRVEGK